MKVTLRNLYTHFNGAIYKENLMQSVKMFGHNPYTKLGLTHTPDVVAVTASPMALLTSP